MKKSITHVKKHVWAMEHYLNRYMSATYPRKKKPYYFLKQIEIGKQLIEQHEGN